MRENMQSIPQYNNVMLTGIILLANTDVTGLVNYSVKALVGGAIWLGYKIIADTIDRKKNKNK